MPTDQQIANACASMTAVIIRMMTDTARKGDRIVGPTHVDAWADAQELLVEQLQITTALIPEPDGRAFHHLTTDATNLPAHFADGNLNHTFDAIFHAYIELSSGFNELPTTQFPFQAKALPAHAKPDDRKENSVQSLMDLAVLGYLETTSQGYRWTQKAAPHMVKAGVWHPDGHAHFDAKEAEVEVAASAFLSNIPDEIASILRIDPDKAFWPIHRALSGKAWYQQANTAVINRIIEMFKDKRR